MVCQEAMLSCPGQLGGIKGCPSEEDPRRVWSGGTISPGRASRGSCQSFTWVETDLLLPQALPFMCLARPGPCAGVPARMPQARSCRPMRSGRGWAASLPSRLAAHASQSASRRTGPAWVRGRAVPGVLWGVGPGYGSGEASVGSLASWGVASLALAVQCCSRRPVKESRGAKLELGPLPMP